MDHLQLPPLPPNVTSLTNGESQRLASRYPHVDYDPRRTCITCKGKKAFRWYLPNSRTDIDTYDCNCVNQYLLVRHLMNSGIGTNYGRLTIADYIHIAPSAKSAAGDYLANMDDYMAAGVGMTISGTRGNGKSLLAYLILKGLIAEGTNVYATTFGDMIESFSAGWTDPEHKAWFAGTVRHAPMLYIDDLGRERGVGEGKAVSQNMLETVVRARSSASLPTIITTNMTPEEVAQGYGGPTMSLLTEVNIEVQVVGVDRRAQMRERTLNEVRMGLTRPVVLA